MNLHSLAAAAGASALHAAVAGAVAGHDGSAGGAAWGVAHVVHALHGVGGVVDSSVFHGEVSGLGGVGRVGGDSLFGWGGSGVEVNRRSFDSGCASAQDDTSFVSLLIHGGVERGDDVAAGALDGAFDGDGVRVCRLRSESGEEGELLAGEEADLHPAEEVVHDGLGVADLLVAGPAGGLEAGVGELLAEHPEGNAVLEGERDGGGEGVHESGDGGAFFGHADEDLAGLAVGVEADGDVALVSGERELVGDAGALGGQAVTDGAGRSLGVDGVGVLAGGLGDGEDLGFERGDADVCGCPGGGDGLLDLNGTGSDGGDGVLLLLGLAVGGGDVERLGALGVVAVDGDGLEALAPGLDVGLGDVFDGGVLREVDGLRDGSGEEGLGGGHHLDVAHVVDGAGSLGGLEGAVEDGEVLGLDVGRALDGSGGVDVADDGVDLGVGVAELEERGGDGVVDDLDHAAADELLVLDEGEVGLDAGGVAVHHEADGSGGSEDGDLGVAVAELLAVGEGSGPGVARGVDELLELRGDEGLGGVAGLADVVDLGAVHADDVEEGLAVDVEAGAGSAGDLGLLGERGGCAEGGAELGDPRGLPVGVAAEDGGDGGGEVASGVGVVRQAEGHQESAEVGVAEAERAVVVRVLGDVLGGVTGGVDDDLHRGGDDGDAVAVGGDVELASRSEELQEIEGSKVAGRVVEEHVLGAGIGRVDAAGVLAGVPAIDGGVVLHAGVAAEPGGFGDLVHDVAGAVLLDGRAGLDGAGGEGGVGLDRGHELVGDADGVVGVLEEDGAVGFGVRTGAVIAGGHERVGLGLFLLLALDKVDDVGMIDVKDDHLGGTAGLAAGLDDAGEGVEAAHEGERARSGASAREGFHGAADAREVGAGAGSPLEEHALGLGEGQDGVERVIDGVDEAGGALRLAVAGDGELDGAGMRVPVPVLCVGVGLQPVAPDVEPDRRVEGDLLIDEQVAEFGVEDFSVVRGGEVAALHAPVANGLSDAGDQGADAGLALGGSKLAMQVLRSDDICRGHRPVRGDLDVLLFEDELALEVLDDCVTKLPGDIIEGRDPGLCEVAREGEARSTFGSSGSRLLGGEGGGCFFGNRSHEVGSFSLLN